jgi:tetratricopeptide (TPR) repeat protein
MPLRIANLETVHAEPQSASEWRLRVERIIAAGGTAVRAGDVQALAAAFADAKSLAEAQRAYQATRALVELVFATPARPGEVAWLDLYLTAGAATIAMLEEEPREPVLLNYAGVVLYELTENAAAKELFQAALRLDPALPHARENLAAVKGRPSRALQGRRAAAAHALAARAAAVARRAKPAAGLTLSVVMIVKDEEEMLPGCLEPLAGSVDEIVVVDTGSSDRTREIAESFGAKVVEFPWNGSFADARNASLDAASGDWVMYVDADEHLVAEDAPKLRELLGRTWREAFYVIETNYTGGDDSGAAVAHAALRIWRNRPGYRFEGRIHEQITPSMPIYLPDRFETTQIRLLHYGYLKSRIHERAKSQRNIELLEKEAAESPTPFTWFNLGSEHLILGDHARARDYLDRAWEELRREEHWSGRGYAPLLTRRVISARRESGDLAAARRAIHEGLEVYPKHTDLLFELALVERSAGDTEAALAAAERCLAQGDADPHLSGTVGSGTFLALCLLAELHQDKGDRETAERYFVRSLQEYPEYGAPVLPLAISMLERGAPPEEVAAVVPDRPSASLLAATAFYESGHTEVAEAWFRRVLERQPANPVARIGLVETLLAQSRWEEAAAEAALEPDDSPLAAVARSSELFAYAALGDASRLAEALARPGLPPQLAPFFAAWRAALAGEPLPAQLPAACAPDAERCLEALLRVRAFAQFELVLPVFERIALPARDRRELLARLYFRRGYLDSAADEWIAVARSAPDAAALIGLAQVAHARGLPEDARLLAGEAARLDPADERARLLVDALAARAA